MVEAILKDKKKILPCPRTCKVNRNQRLYVGCLASSELKELKTDYPIKPALRSKLLNRVLMREGVG